MFFKRCRAGMIAGALSSGLFFPERPLLLCQPRPLLIRSSGSEVRGSCSPPSHRLFSLVCSRVVSRHDDGRAALFSPTPPFLAEAPGQDFAPKVRREMGRDPRAAAEEQPGDRRADHERAKRVSCHHGEHGVAAETILPLRIQVSLPTPLPPFPFLQRPDVIPVGTEPRSEFLCPFSIQIPNVSRFFCCIVCYCFLVLKI